MSIAEREHPLMTAPAPVLTGAEPIGPYDFRARARRPGRHPYLRADTGPGRDGDPMLLLEFARQAEAYAARAFYGVDAGARTVLRRWSAAFAAAGVPEWVDLHGAVRPRTIGGRLRGMVYDLTLRAGDHRLGTVRMEMGYPRATAASGPPPARSRAGFGAGLPSPGRPVDPRRVGRRRATDTVLRDLETAGGRIVAGLRVPVENPGLLGPAREQVPGMVLTEAARQIAALAVAEWGGPGPDRTVPAALAVTFADQADPAVPVVLTAGAGDRPGRVRVTVEQGSAVIASADLTMTGVVVRP
ncbi:AfsA-related hotdog domain-containing protein [Actinoplanes sp. G11-F43]|uniref:AfsA-related hotdog domain-containing protein n=1 Tax=Actinoplanes sp. G11-F43 TaxID=3424130 RepID=UPI003D343300